MKKIDTYKLIGLAGTGLALVATLISSYASDKQMVKTIEEKVAEALANQSK